MRIRSKEMGKLIKHIFGHVLSKKCFLVVPLFFYICYAHYSFLQLDYKHTKGEDISSLSIHQYSRSNVCFNYVNILYGSKGSCLRAKFVPKRVACTSSHPEWASYTMRCRHLAAWFRIYGKRDCDSTPEFEIVLKSVNEILIENATYHSIILVKSKIPADLLANSKKVGHIFEDIVDQSFQKLPSNVTVIVQNKFQQKYWQSTHNTMIIEHAPSSIIDVYPPKVESKVHLNVVSVQQVDNVCMKLPKSDYFRYECHVTRKTLSTAGSYDLFVKKVGPKSRLAFEREYIKTLSTPSCLFGTGFLFTKFFQQYDIIVVYTKSGIKSRMNSVQRMSNAMTSGVVTVVQRTGVHELYIPPDYPCQFDLSWKSLYTVLESLARDLELRKECLKRAENIIISNKLTVPDIVEKYEIALNSFPHQNA